MGIREEGTGGEIVPAENAIAIAALVLGLMVGFMLGYIKGAE